MCNHWPYSFHLSRSARKTLSPMHGSLPLVDHTVFIIDKNQSKIVYLNGKFAASLLQSLRK